VVRLLALLLIGLATLSCKDPIPPTKPVPIGMTLHFRGADPANIARQFELMAAMKMSWVRIDIDWSAVESQRGQFDWGYSDAIVREAAARRMNVLTVLAYTPAWTRSSASSNYAARPDHLDDFANFTRAAAERYAAQGVHAWEIWNEPNTHKFWPSRPDAKEYGRLFRAASDAIRGVDAAATVLIGGLAPNYGDDESDIDPASYLEQLYADGTAQLADGIAAHPYSFPALPMDTVQPMVGGFKDLPKLHGVMDAHGDGQKKIWITEFGAPTGTGPNAVSEDAQSTALLQARREVAAWPWAGPLMYYELVDGGTDLTDIEQNFGVYRHGLAPKAAAIALAKNASG
jgi:hypothetical protein